MSGYVYLIGSYKFGWYKIGKSQTPTIRIKDLGILLPFKIEIIGIWQAKNHSLMESALHEKYSKNRINGEWFEFTRKELDQTFNSIPESVRVYPSLENKSPFSTFSNIDKDLIQGKKFSIKKQKCRGNFTEEERNKKRLLAMEEQRRNRMIRDSQISFDFN